MFSSKNTKPFLLDINAIPLIFKQIQSLFRGFYFLNIIWNETVISIHDWHDDKNNNDNEIQQWKIVKKINNEIKNKSA